MVPSSRTPCACSTVELFSGIQLFVCRFMSRRHRHSSLWLPRPDPSSRYNESLQLTAWCRAALQQLPPAHFNTFVYLVALGREILAQRSKNLCTMDQIGTVRL